MRLGRGGEAGSVRATQEQMGWSPIPATAGGPSWGINHLTMASAEQGSGRPNGVFGRAASVFRRRGESGGRSPVAEPVETGRDRGREAVAATAPVQDDPQTAHLKTIFPNITSEGLTRITAMNAVLASEPLGRGFQIGQPIPEPIKAPKSGKQSMPGTWKWIGTDTSIGMGYPFGLLGEQWHNNPGTVNTHTSALRGKNRNVVQAEIADSGDTEAVKMKKAQIGRIQDSTIFTKQLFYPEVKAPDVADDVSTRRVREELAAELRAQAPKTRDKLAGPTAMVDRDSWKITDAKWSTPRNE